MVSALEKNMDMSALGTDNSCDPLPIISPESVIQSISSDPKDNWMVTGGAGFIGANFVLSCRAERYARIFNLDRLGSAGNLASLDRLREDQDHVFIRGDIRNRVLVQRVLHEYMPNAVIHFAAETSVEREADAPESFIQNNVFGTFSLLEEVRGYWESMDAARRRRFRFLHVSAPEVYGALKPGTAPHDENAPYNPAGIHGASKAACDHLVRAYGQAHGLPVLIINSAPCFGPFQFPREPVPRAIFDALAGEEPDIPANGTPSRDWVHVEDFCAAVRAVLEQGRVGETYHVSAGWERTDREMIRMVRAIIGELRPDLRAVHSLPEIEGAPVEFRSALDSGKIRRELGWRPQKTFESALRGTVRWFLGNTWWVDTVRTGEYRFWTNHRSMERRMGTG